MKTQVIIDLEDYALNNKNVPKNAHYRIKVDRSNFIIEQECLTGTQILELASKTPINQYQLNQKLAGGIVKKIGYDENVDFTSPGIERFMTLPLDQQEG